MKKLIATAVLVATLLLCAAVSASGTGGYLPGDVLPDFSVELCDGSVFSLKEALATHDAVMINIWASWCGPCRAEFPYMEQAYARSSDRIALVCLSAFDSNDEIAAFKEENGLSILPMGFDSVGLTDALVREGYPTSVIVDRFGVYAYYECGSMTDADKFTEIWDHYTGSGYSSSRIFDGQWRNTREVPSSSQLTAAACTDSRITLYCADSAYIWPFVPGDSSVTAINETDSCRSALCGTVTAQAGEVLAFDYLVDCDPLCSLAVLSVDGVRVQGFSGTKVGSWGYRFDHSGTYDLLWEFDTQTGSDMFLNENSFRLSNLRILDPDSGIKYLNTLPSFPHDPDAEGILIEFLDRNTEKLLISDDIGLIDYLFGDSPIYLIPADRVPVHIRIGETINESLTFLYSDYYGEHAALCDLKTDSTGYLAEIALSKISTAYSNTYISVYGEGLSLMAVVFADEESLNYFTDWELPQAFGGDVPGLSYRTDDSYLPQTPTEEYRIFVCSENGEPLEGVLVNICSEDRCSPLKTGADGCVRFLPFSDSCSIHILQVPEGYFSDPNAEYIMDGAYLQIRVRHS